MNHNDWSMRIMNENLGHNETFGVSRASIQNAKTGNVQLCSVINKYFAMPMPVVDTRYSTVLQSSRMPRGLILYQVSLCIYPRGISQRGGAILIYVQTGRLL